LLFPAEENAYRTSLKPCEAGLKIASRPAAEPSDPKNICPSWGHRLAIAPIIELAEPIFCHSDLKRFGFHDRTYAMKINVRQCHFMS
jgi:hypothetical protein